MMLKQRVRRAMVGKRGRVRPEMMRFERRMNIMVSTPGMARIVWPASPRKMRSFADRDAIPSTGKLCSGVSCVGLGRV